jgi:hypothetical protein
MVAQDLRQMVKIGAGQIVDVRRREFSAGRTALAVGGGVLGAALIIGMIFGAEESVDVGDPNEDLGRIPPISIPFRLPGVGP